MTDGYVIVLTTISLDVDASVLGTRLVEERLAACVNVLPPKWIPSSAGAEPWNATRSGR